MLASNEPIYITYAKEMLGVNKLPEELEYNLVHAETLIKKVKPCGTLSSTQTISAIILQWMAEYADD